MRLECTFKATAIPITYHYLFASLIKKAIAHSSSEFYEEMYLYNDKKTKRSKNFTFSVFLNDYSIEKDEIDVKGNIKWVISSPSDKFILFLYNGLLDNKKFNYKEKTLILDKVRLMNEILPKESEVIFKTLSPIVIKNKIGKFIGPEDSEYIEALNYICNQNLKNIRGTGLKKALNFVPIQMKKQVVKQKHEEFKSINEEGILYVTAYRGIFKLEGDIEDLRLLTQAGLGFRRSQGFGLLALM